MKHIGYLPTPRLLPWDSWQAFGVVVRLLDAAGTDPVSRQQLIGILQAWQSRGRTPIGVSTTLAILCCIQDDLHSSNHAATTSSGAFVLTGAHLSAATAVTRFINSLADTAQTGQYAASIADLMRKLSVARWLVDIRHEAAHGALPSLPTLRLACAYVMSFLREHYWNAQLQAVTASAGALPSSGDDAAEPIASRTATASCDSHQQQRASKGTIPVQSLIIGRKRRRPASAEDDGSGGDGNIAAPPPATILGAGISFESITAAMRVPFRHRSWRNAFKQVDEEANGRTRGRTYLTANASAVLAGVAQPSHACTQVLTAAAAAGQLQPSQGVSTIVASAVHQLLDAGNDDAAALQCYSTLMFAAGRCCPSASLQCLALLRAQLHECACCLVDDHAGRSGGATRQRLSPTVSRIAAALHFISSRHWYSYFDTDQAMVQGRGKRGIIAIDAHTLPEWTDEQAAYMAQPAPPHMMFGLAPAHSSERQRESGDGKAQHTDNTNLSPPSLTARIDTDTCLLELVVGMASIAKAVLRRVGPGSHADDDADDVAAGSTSGAQLIIEWAHACGLDPMLSASDEEPAASSSSAQPRPAASAGASREAPSAAASAAPDHEFDLDDIEALLAGTPAAAASAATSGPVIALAAAASDGTAAPGSEMAAAVERPSKPRWRM